VRETAIKVAGWGPFALLLAEVHRVYWMGCMCCYGNSR